MSADYILPPCFADIYSAGSVRGLLTKVLPLWLSWRAKVVEEQNGLKVKGRIKGDQHQYVLRPTPPKILPFLVNNYDLDTESRMNYHQSGFFLTIVHFIENLPANDEGYDITTHFQRNNGRMVLSLIPRIHGAMQACRHCFSINIV